MVDILLALILLLIVAGAVVYIRKQKKKGIKCIGCPDAPRCNAGASCNQCDGNCKERV